MMNQSDEQPKKKKKKAYPKPAAVSTRGRRRWRSSRASRRTIDLRLSKIFWAHIKANNLQSDPSNKRIIVCDDKLKALFGVERFEMFQLAKHIGLRGGEEGKSPASTAAYSDCGVGGPARPEHRMARTQDRAGGRRISEAMGGIRRRPRGVQAASWENLSAHLSMATRAFACFRS